MLELETSLTNPTNIPDLLRTRGSVSQLECSRLRSIWVLGTHRQCAVHVVGCSTCMVEAWAHHSCLVATLQFPGQLPHCPRSAVGMDYWRLLCYLLLLIVNLPLIASNYLQLLSSPSYYITYFAVERFIFSL